MEIFEEYKAAEAKVYTLKDIINIDKSRLRKMFFVFSQEYI